eukprot:COSAG01_NODE_2060_length_8520_cov_4.178839_5_plen_58_part_00
MHHQPARDARVLGVVGLAPTPQRPRQRLRHPTHSMVGTVDALRIQKHRGGLSKTEGD